VVAVTQPGARVCEVVGRLVVPAPAGDADWPGEHDRDTDQRLVEMSRAGDTDAYRVLARRHRARLYRSALRTLADSGDPEDVMGDMLDHLRTSLAVFAEASPR
jgi:hypothetical protein